MEMRSKVVHWLSYVSNTEFDDTIKWLTMEPLFNKQNGIKIKTVSNVWDFSKLKHDKSHNLYELKLEVTALINNMGATTLPFQFEAKEADTLKEVKKITTDSHKNLKNAL
jgi:hypothetical protein